MVSRASSQLVKDSIPEKTRRILKELDLPSDFLSSDSSLSDVPSGVSVSLSTCSSPVKAPDIPPTVPRTPRRSTSPVTTIVSRQEKAPRLKLPKISHYFPKPLIDPESCLPFPPIDIPTFGLVQEQLAHDPFRLLVATIFLNRTRGGVALPVLFQVFERFPTIEAMASADRSELVAMIHCLGFQNQRAKKCVALAQTWLSHPPAPGRRYRKLHYPQKLDGRDVGREECIADEDPRVAWEISHLPGVGAYALDSWRIFCRDELRGLARDWNGNGASTPGFVPEWKSVVPQDKELRAYLTWMWLKEGWMWDRQTGTRTRASAKMMRAARRGGVAHEQDGGEWVLETSPVKVANGL
jgi:endonuclease III